MASNNNYTNFGQQLKHKREELDDLYYEDVAAIMQQIVNNKQEAGANNKELADSALSKYEQVHKRMQELEATIFYNSQLIMQLLNESALAATTTTLENKPKWYHLMCLESSCIGIHDRKSMKLLGLNATARAFLNKYNNGDAIETLKKPASVLPVIPPLFLLLSLNLMHSNAVKHVSFKIFVPIVTVLMQVHLHYDYDEYYWYEFAQVVPAVYDDAFVMDGIVSTATMQVALPTEDTQLAYQTYLHHSNSMYCKLIAAFVQRNDNKFFLETTHLLQHVFNA